MQRSIAMELRTPQSTPLSQSNRLGAFAHPAFAVVWTASTIATIGIAMYDTASGWLMTTLDLDPLYISLVHAATNLPMFLFTLPAGALADIVDPRRLIMAVSCCIAALIAAFAALVSFYLASPVSLLLTTFFLSAAWSLNAPAWLSILPVLVPKADLPGAIAAHGVAHNLSRTIGPALGGFAIVNFGVSTPFWAVVAANLGVIAALMWWRAPPRVATLPAERLTSAVRTGVRHAANNRLLWATLVEPRGLSVRRRLLGALAADRVANRPRRRTLRHSSEHDQRRVDSGVLPAAIPAGADRPRLDGGAGNARHRRRARPIWLDASISRGARRLSLRRRRLGDHSDQSLRLGSERASGVGARTWTGDFPHRHFQI